jgi:hypothetical protein
MEPAKIVDLVKINELRDKYKIFSNNFRTLIIGLLTNPNKSGELLKTYLETVNKKKLLEKIKISE